ncbi:PREDICTED: uncharacterized protein LOC104824043 [Tarenaya hassleriana]|uniref:uncharacterized protein LOC104824043 n=1 Tax=Tarenaya hassleriana TaxID=28532 RepID=UPI00053C1F15|nr:PREDICTED: uncharacterized protein LOC104824043 [Tarenaya hassleriana]
MYVTRRLSEYQRNPPPELTQTPPEGPNSGVLVIQDEESQPQCCFGLCYDSELRGFPFPQNAKLTVRYTTGSGEHRRVSRNPVVFIPVLGQPLSSNRYYVVKRRGKHSGEAHVCAKEEDRVPCCFCLSYVPDAKPKPLNPHDIYQQFEIFPRRSSNRHFSAKSIAPDGVPPHFLRRKGWTMEYSTSESFGLRDDAKGIDRKLRNELPDLDMSVTVGKWYVPFIFVKEGEVKDQIKRSMYYSMTLEQSWEEVYSQKNIHNEGHEVVVEVDTEAEVVKLEGKVIAQSTRRVDAEGMIGFSGEEEKNIGLGSAVVERMRWEEERFGWRSRDDNRVGIVKRSQKVDWKSYKCYVLVESFVLKRMDGSLVLTYEFKHGDKLKDKWD